MIKTIYHTGLKLGQYFYFTNSAYNCTRVDLLSAYNVTHVVRDSRVPIITSYINVYEPVKPVFFVISSCQ